MCICYTDRMGIENGAPAGLNVRCSNSSVGSSNPNHSLVEDQAFVRDVACEILGGAGYRVLPARNAAEAMQTFRGHPQKVELLLTDVVLPDRNGCDMALELASGGHTFKAIFVSGYPENSITRNGLQHPGWFYLPKPFSAASLLQKVTEACTRFDVVREPAAVGREGWNKPGSKRYLPRVIYPQGCVCGRRNTSSVSRTAKLESLATRKSISVLATFGWRCSWPGLR